MAAQRRVNVIVFDGNPMHDWVELFKDKTLIDGRGIYIVQCSWMEANVTVYADSGCQVTIAPIRESDGNIERPATFVVKPDFCIVRNQPRGPTPNQDRRHVLFGLMHHNVPCINSLHSIYCNLERPIMFGELKRIEKEVGHEAFPLISQTYYANHRQMVLADDMPLVAKVSHAHAGMGKMLIKSMEEFRDLATVLALVDPIYMTAEPFIEGEMGIRVQKIGPSIRVYTKQQTGSGWKSQFGGARLDGSAEVEEKYILWAELASTAFGGMDILALDGIRGVDGNDYIIELNGTSIGITTEYWEEDTKVLINLALDRMTNLFCGGAFDENGDVYDESLGGTSAPLPGSEDSVDDV